MENKVKSALVNIDRVLNNKQLLKKQRDALSSFDRYNELEGKCGLYTRVSYLMTLNNLGVNVRKPYEKMTKEDIQKYFVTISKERTEGTINLQKAHVKRFFKFLKWIKVDKEKKDERRKTLVISNLLTVYDG